MRWLSTSWLQGDVKSKMFACLGGEHYPQMQQQVYGVLGEGQGRGKAAHKIIHQGEAPRPIEASRADCGSAELEFQ